MSERTDVQSKLAQRSFFKGMNLDSLPSSMPDGYYREAFSNVIETENANTFGVASESSNELFIDYDTFGEHQWEDTGIFDFLRQLPAEILEHPDNSFMTPSEVIDNHEVHDEVDIPHTVTWADTERDLSAWLGNDMQHTAVDKLYSLKPLVESTEDADILEDWQRLQTSDHLYYMCTKYFSDGDVHAYFNPYDSPYEAFITYMNVITDLEHRCQKKVAGGTEKPAAAAVSV